MGQQEGPKAETFWITTQDLKQMLPTQRNNSVAFKYINKWYVAERWNLQDLETNWLNRFTTKLISRRDIVKYNNLPMSRLYEEGSFNNLLGLIALTWEVGPLE